MNRPNREQQKELVRIWGETGRVLDAMRLKALRDKPYDWKEVDALLELGANYDGPVRTTSGLVEQQRYFMRGRPKDVADES